MRTGLGRIGSGSAIWTSLCYPVSVGNGTITSHALMSLEARGVLFVSPGMEVNPVRTKELTNVRAAAKDENVRLTPPRLMTLEEAIGYVA
ncbi:hypothetical protein Taro_005392 [Colocasia esculenta]|uniref:TypA/BipA C-terminal domain-containing protein n=1 Tax=Colocasia esculenta TaxID=4460 RepID=A0A843TUF1_COLES|nr:hypothetical protein [Colocasia esculenta]